MTDLDAIANLVAPNAKEEAANEQNIKLVKEDMQIDVAGSKEQEIETTEEQKTVNLQYHDPLCKEYITTENNRYGRPFLKPSLHVEPEDFTEIEIIKK